MFSLWFKVEDDKVKDIAESAIEGYQKVNFELERDFWDAHCYDYLEVQDGKVILLKGSDRENKIKQKILDENNVFTKLQIRRAMRALGNEDELDTLLANNSGFQKDWNDASEIDLSDSMVQQALTQIDVDIIAIKKKILNIT